jgi:hypothetical protein
LFLPRTKKPFVQLDQPPFADLSGMARAVFTGHEATAMSTARRTVVLLRVTSLNIPALVVAAPGSRYFITVVTFTHISGLPSQ